MVKCEYCAKTFDRNWILQRHKREVHERKLQFQCGKCKKKFIRKSYLNYHEQTCYRCQTCNTQFDLLQEKKNHARKPPRKVRIVENEQAEKVQCPGIELRTDPSLAQPQPIVVEKTLLNSLRNQCGKCEKKFKRKFNLDRHEKTCCRCQRCNTQFDSLQEKKNHACTLLKKTRIAENEHAELVQCPGIELHTEPSPAQSQPIVVEKTPLNSLRNETEQSPHPSPSPQLPTIPSGAPATVLTSPPPLTPAPRRRKSLKIKRPNAVSNLPPPPPLKAAPGFFATSPEPPQKILKKEKAEIRKKQREINDTETIDKQDPDLKPFIHLNWDSIRTFSRRGPIQNLFNFYYNDDMRNLIVDIAKTIMKNQKTQFKINYSFGFVLRNIETGDFRYYHASNNTLMLDTAVLISNKTELNEL